MRFLGLAKAEVRDTGFPSGAESKTTQLYHVYPTLGNPNSCCANMHRLGIFVFVCHRVHIAFGVFVFVYNPCHNAFFRRDIISLGGRVAWINQPTNHPYLLFFV